MNSVLNVRVAGALINVVVPAAEVRIEGSRLGNTEAMIQVAQGCEGIDVIILVVGAILLTPMTMPRKILGAFFGGLLIYALNVVRISGLWCTLRYWPSAFDTMHFLVGQTVIVVAGLGFYAAWVFVPERETASAERTKKGKFA